MSTLTLVLTAVGSVLLLLFLVMKARMHAFVALMVVSIGAGLFSGMPLDKIAATMEKGMGGTLGFLAIVVALGAMFGKILHETGAVDQIAVKMLKSFGLLGAEEELSRHSAQGQPEPLLHLPERRFRRDRKPSEGA